MLSLSTSAIALKADLRGDAPAFTTQYNEHHECGHSSIVRGFWVIPETVRHGRTRVEWLSIRLQQSSPESCSGAYGPHNAST